jgi:hypothetical protein
VDYLLDSFNGGEVKLTSGDYRFADPVVLKNGVKIVGCGQSTRILPADNTVTTLIDFGTATNATIESFNIDGDGSSIVYTTTVGPILGRRLGKAINVNITNYYIKPTSTTKAFVGFYMMVATYNCDVYEITAENDGGIPRLYGFQLCTGVTNCSIYSNEVIGNGWIQGMVNCDNISNCTIYSNTSTSGTVHIIGYYICNNITSSSYHDNSVNGTSEIFGYYQSYNISSCTSVDNTSVNVGVVSFFECIRVSVCSTSGNVSSGTNEWGYWGCRSVQQCKASGESLPYGTGTNQSYADSAGAAGYECDDTPEGGYNS